MTEKIKKQNAAGKNDRVELTYMDITKPDGRSPLKVAKGNRYYNEFLKNLGFVEDKDGAMVLSTAPHQYEKDENGKIVKRTANGRVLTESKKAKEEDQR